MKFYKIFVSSSDVVTGNWQNGNYYVDVNADELDPRYNWQICVENFSISDAFPNGIMLTCPNLPIIDGMYCTTTKMTQNILFATNGNAYQKVVDFNSIGAKIMSPTNFRSIMLNFVLTDFTGTPLATAPAPTWGMIIHINSVNRTSGTPGNFTLTFGNELFKVSRPDGVIRVEPIQAVISRSWYSVDTSCQTFQLAVNGGDPSTITIPIGNYNVQSFLLLLQNNLLGLTWLIGWQLETNRYFFQAPDDGNTYTLIFPCLCSYLFGFAVGTSVDVTYNNPVYSTNPVKMSIESVVLVHINFAKQNFAAVDNLLTSQFVESDIFLKVPVNCSPFDSLIWRANGTDIVAFDLTSRDITSLNVYLTDEYNRVLSPRYDWTLSFRITYKEIAHPLASIQATLDGIQDYLKYMATEEMRKAQREEREAILARSRKGLRVSGKKK